MSEAGFMLENMQLLHKLHIKQEHCCGRFSFYLFMSSDPSLDQVLTGDFWRKQLTCIVPSHSENRSPPCAGCLHQCWGARWKLLLGLKRATTQTVQKKQQFNFKEPFGCQHPASPQWETKPFVLMCQPGLQPSGLESRNSWMSVDY